MNGFVTALVGALLLGGLSTAYDAVWAAWIPRHRAVYGLVHGMTLLSAVGLVLGWPPRRPWTGLLGGALAGLTAAASFYALAPWLRMSAMFPAWMLLWLLFALVAWTAALTFVAVASSCYAAIKIPPTEQFGIIAQNYYWAWPIGVAIVRPR